MKTKKCLRCGKDFYHKYCALSCRDNDTEICSTCGEAEAMFDFMIHQPNINEVYSSEELNTMKIREQQWIHE